MSICSNARLKSNDVGSINKELNYIRKWVCMLAGQGSIGQSFTTAERDALSSPTNGTIIYNSTTNKLNVYADGGWQAITSA